MGQTILVLLHLNLPLSGLTPGFLEALSVGFMGIFFFFLATEGFPLLESSSLSETSAVIEQVEH